MDVRITAPLLNDIRADPILFPTLWNVSYGFLLRQEKTSVHRVMYDQKTTAIIRMTTIGAGSVPHLASEHNIVMSQRNIVISHHDFVKCQDNSVMLQRFTQNSNTVRSPHKIMLCCVMTMQLCVAVSTRQCCGTVLWDLNVALWHHNSVHCM